MATDDNSVILKKGLMFKNEEEIKEFMERYSKSKKQMFVKGRTSSSNSTKIRGRCNRKNLKYYYITYVCKYGKSRESVSTNKRAASTFKRGCAAFIYFRISKARDSYNLSNFCDLHANHDGLEIYFEHLPENRKLNSSEEKEALQCLSFKCKPARLQVHLRKKSQKQIRSKDLLNLLAKVKDKTTDDIPNAVKSLQDHGARVKVLHENGKFEGLFYTTEDMRENMSRYPEIIFVDGTYKLFKQKFVLMLIVIEDNNGRSKIVAVGILNNETRPTLKWFFQCFKTDNENACLNIQGIMTDKDMTERSAAKEIFPHASLFICQFHALKTFSREISTNNMHISIAERNDALLYIDKMVKCRTESEYNYWYEKFQGCSKVIVQYFDKNWHNNKNEWTRFSIFKSNFGNLTNNRIESINSKIKGFLIKNNSLGEFIKDFFEWMEYRDLESTYKDIQKVIKVSVNNKYVESTDSKKFQDALSDYAFRYVNEQMQLSKSITFRNIDKDKQQGFIKYCNEELLVTPTYCICFDNWSMLLPCRHIFACRKVFEYPLFCDRLYDKRWKKTTVKFASQENITTNHIVNVQRVATPKKLTSTEKQRQLRKIFDELKNYMLEQSEHKFNNNLSTLDSLLSMWKNNKNVALYNPDESTTNCVSDPQVNQQFDLTTSFKEISINDPEDEASIKTCNIPLENIKKKSPTKTIGHVSNAFKCTIATKKNSRKKALKRLSDL